MQSTTLSEIGWVCRGVNRLASATTQGEEGFSRPGRWILGLMAFQKPHCPPGREAVNQMTGDVVTAAQVMILVQFLQIAIGGSDGIHAHSDGVDWHPHPLPTRKEFECLTLSLVEHHDGI